MDMMEIRRRVLMGQTKSGPVDTSPKIAEYGVFWNRTQGGKTANTDWCVTEEYEFSPILAGITLVGYIGKDAANITFQYYGYVTQTHAAYSGWYYFNVGDKEGTRDLSAINTLERITFSIRQDKLSDCYVYVRETGQILFAGINSVYYGYTNIHDMP